MQEGCIQGQFCPLLEAGGCMDAFFWEKGHPSREVIPFVLVQVDLHIELLLWELRRTCRSSGTLWILCAFPALLALYMESFAMGCCSMQLLSCTDSNFQCLHPHMGLFLMLVFIICLPSNVTVTSTSATNSQGINTIKSESP